MDERIRAADAWGPTWTLERRWFLLGWDDAAAGHLDNRPFSPWDISALCAYNSGVVAQREGSPMLKVRRHNRKRFWDVVANFLFK